jgi:hypothetical protein
LARLSQVMLGNFIFKVLRGAALYSDVECGLEKNIMWGAALSCLVWSSLAMLSKAL